MSSDMLSKAISSSKPSWDGKRESYAVFAQSMKFFLVAAKFGWVIDSIQKECGEKVPDEDDDSKRTKNRVYAMLAMSVPPSEMQQIQHDQDYPEDDENRIGMDPNKLWKAFEKPQGADRHDGQWCKSHQVQWEGLGWR